MDQDETTTPATDDAGPERGPILGTLLIRVTLRDDPGGADDRPALPTNEAASELVEAAFRAGGYAHVNATVEKV